ncbi:MAG: ADOP family duplicated permease [Vicinamibacterales bacterium]
MGGWFGDLRVSVRQLAKAPGFTAAAIVVLALGIGLNAAMFSLVYAFGLMGRPYADPDRVVQLYSSKTSTPDSYRAFSYAAYRELASHPEVFSGVFAHNPTLVGVGEGGDSRRAFAALVSREYFEVLGVPIVRGRGFTAQESRPGQDIPVTIVSWAYWQKTGFDPDVIGREIRVNGRPFTIIGVTPRGFTGTMMVFGPELFFPFGVFDTVSNDFQGETARTLERPDAFNLFLVARLADGVDPAGLDAPLSVVAGRLASTFPAEYEDARLTAGPLPRFGTSTSPSDESVLGLLALMLLGLTGAVLLTVCLNLASLLMARGSARRKEFAVRLALGGGRFRIVRQLLLEGFLLSLAGGTAGILLGFYGVDTLMGAFASMLPLTIVLEGATSPAVVAATFFFCLLATGAFALGPALRHSTVDVLADLKPHAGDDTTRRRRRWLPRNPLVVAQVALSLALLIAAGLWIRMAQTALSVDLGYRADSTVMAEVDGKLAGLSSPQVLDLYSRVTTRLAALPGSRAAVGALVPLGMVHIGREVRRAGIQVPDDAKPATPETGRALGADWNAVSGEYFDVMGVSLLQGRTFTAAESFQAGGPPVVILDEVLARKLWPDGSALGQQVQFTVRDGGRPDLTYDVVGIAATTRRDLFEKEPSGAVYEPFGQSALGNAYFHVRPATAAPGFADEVRRVIHAEAPGLPMFSARTFGDHVASAIEYWALKLAASLFGVFGGLAMVVALVGIYGVMSYAVARRTREIGIRMAVGARPRSVQGMVLGESLSMTLAGLAIGLVLGIGTGQALASIFVDLSPFDAVVFSLVPIGFLVAAVAAAWFPARRATRVQPMQALRTE